MGNFYDDYKSCGICNTLLNYTLDRDSEFYKYHFIFPKKIYNDRSEWELIKHRFPKEKDLMDFLKASNDEVRLMKADDFSAAALTLSDLRDAAYFRNAIMRKELSAEIDFKKQRDHAAHTLYNYLIGWYFFEKSPMINSAMKTHIRMREFNLSCRGEIDKETFAFGIVWTFASLLHDIGYLLEGSLSNLSLDVEVAHVSKGAAIMHDYFNHFFWRHIDLDYKAARDIVRRLNLYVPDFKSIKSLSALSDNLSVLGDCEPIRSSLAQDFRELVLYNRPININDLKKILEQSSYLDIDSFKLWELHYSFYNQNNTAELIKHVGSIFHNLVWDGHPTYNSRTINHGVASGLLSLMFSTYFYQIYFGLESVKKIEKSLKKYVKVLNVSCSKLVINVPNKRLITKIQKDLDNIYPIIRSGFGYGLLPNNGRLLDILSSVRADLQNNDQTNKIDNIKNKVYRFVQLIKEDLDWLETKYNFTSVYDFITKQSIMKHFHYKASNWFSLVLWGTAAAAIHDIVQNKDLWKTPKEMKYIFELTGGTNNGILKLDDSHLCYLGVLVDIIQEWDRYSVIKESVFSEKFQLQGIQVDIRKPMQGMQPLEIKIIENNEVIQKIQSSLDFSLNGWRALIKFV